MSKPVRKERHLQIVEYGLPADYVKRALLSYLAEDDTTTFTKSENTVVIINPDGSAVISTSFDIK